MEMVHPVDINSTIETKISPGSWMMKGSLGMVYNEEYTVVVGGNTSSTITRSLVSLGTEVGLAYHHHFVSSKPS